MEIASPTPIKAVSGGPRPPARGRLENESNTVIEYRHHSFKGGSDQTNKRIPQVQSVPIPFHLGCGRIYRTTLRQTVEHHWGPPFEKARVILQIHAREICKATTTSLSRSIYQEAYILLHEISLITQYVLQGRILPCCLIRERKTHGSLPCFNELG